MVIQVPVAIRVNIEYVKMADKSSILVATYSLDTNNSATIVVILLSNKKNPSITKQMTNYVQNLAQRFLKQTIIDKTSGRTLISLQPTRWVTVTLAVF